MPIPSGETRHAFKPHRFPLSEAHACTHSSVPCNCWLCAFCASATDHEVAPPTLRKEKKCMAPKVAKMD